MEARLLRSLSQILGPLALVGMLAAMYAAFIHAPREATMGDVYRIFFIHVPTAINAYLAFGLGVCRQRSVFVPPQVSLGYACGNRRPARRAFHHPGHGDRLILGAPGLEYVVDRRPAADDDAYHVVHVCRLFDRTRQRCSPVSSEPGSRLFLALLRS